MCDIVHYLNFVHIQNLQTNRPGKGGAVQNLPTHAIIMHVINLRIIINFLIMKIFNHVKK